MIPIGAALGLTLAGAVLITGGLVSVAFAWLDFPDLAGKKPDLSALLEIIKISLAIVAGIGGAVALVVAYRKQRLAEEENHRAREAAHRDATRLFVERFDRASDKLGSESAAVRLSAVHALAALADDWSANRQMCIDVLCAYLRMPSPPEPDQQSDLFAHATWRAMREVQATIIRLIAGHLRPGVSPSWCGHNFDFTGVIFDGDADFSSCQFTGGVIDFTRAQFRCGDVAFRDALFAGSLVRFYQAGFTGARVFFVGAQFSGGLVNFGEAKFTSGQVRFGPAEFTGTVVIMVEATFAGTAVGFDGMQLAEGSLVLWDAEFTGSTVVFDKAQLSGGEIAFNGARLTGGSLSFSDVEFAGVEVSFDKAEFAGCAVTFDGAKFTDGDIDLSSPKDWSHPPKDLPPQSDRLRLPPPTTQCAAHPTDVVGQKRSNL
ncbi:pentapeptide repeat-containing protein [Nonomuraea mangrovi]|uniref:Pentapeptide repeat-containing protein n=1 Tax=Nonomuraea mangrovi TaxID=2316207 RepID=A0ABW4SUZ6_9ACTN